MDRTPFEPLILFRSFMTVVSGFVLAQIVYFAIALALGYLFFPEFLAFFKLDEAQQRRLIEEDIQAAIPWTMFILHVGLTLIAFWFVGWLVASVAPLAHFRHGLFVAVLVMVWFLQSFFADPPSKKVMDLVQMFLLPMAIILGAKRASTVFEAGPDDDK